MNISIEELVGCYCRPFSEKLSWSEVCKEEVSHSPTSPCLVKEILSGHTIECINQVSAYDDVVIGIASYDCSCRHVAMRKL